MYLEQCVNPSVVPLHAAEGVQVPDEGGGKPRYARRSLQEYAPGPGVRCQASGMVVVDT